MRSKPIRDKVGEEDALVHVNPSLNAQVAALTQRRQVPSFTVALVAVEVMHGENVAALAVVLVIAAFATPKVIDLYLVSDLFPAVRILAAHATFRFLADHLPESFRSMTRSSSLALAD